MDKSVAQEQIDAARAYEELFVPALFGPWASRVADLAEMRSGQRVLDVACGTGVLAREAAGRVGAAGSVVGLDPNPGFLAVAEELASGIDWRQGVAGALPFDDESFDVVVSQFGLMFFPDRDQAVAEMIRVLRPGGRLAVAVWDSLDNTPAYATAVALLDRLAGQAAADALRAPFVLGDPLALDRLFADSGFASVEVETRVGTGRFPSLRTMVEADLRGWLPVMGVNLEETVIQEILAQAERDLGAFVTAEGKVEFDSPALIVTATRP